jgi:hypothetical protein
MHGGLLPGYSLEAERFQACADQLRSNETAMCTNLELVGRDAYDHDILGAAGMLPAPMPMARHCSIIAIER